MTERRPISARDTGWAHRITAWLVSVGATPNGISAASVGFAVVAGAWLAYPAAPWTWLVAGLAVQGRLLCNLFDGMVAVEGGKQSVTGELWNDLPDRLSDTAIFVGAGYGCGLPWLGWLAAVAALHVAYVRVLARSAGAATRFEGPMAKQYRMVLLTGGCAVAIFAGDRAGTVISVVLAATVIGCVVTAVRRLSLAAADLRSGIS